jgi:periplasmic divalent cation tolerance protein
MSNAALCYVTCPSLDCAELIARRVIEERLAAAANILPGLRSYYRWQGEVTSAGEHMLLLKTRSSLIEPLTARIATLHPFAVPAIVALPIDGGHAPYLRWIEAETAPPTSRNS